MFGNTYPILQRIGSEFARTAVQTTRNQICRGGRQYRDLAGRERQMPLASREHSLGANSTMSSRRGEKFAMARIAARFGSRVLLLRARWRLGSLDIPAVRHAFQT